MKNLAEQLQNLKKRGGLSTMPKTINLHGHNYTLMTPSHAKGAYNRFCRSSDVDLCDVYGHYSQAKRNAYDYCRAREREFNSYNGVIASYCIMQFTYAFTGFCDGKEYFVYITKDHDYAIPMEDLE